MKITCPKCNTRLMIPDDKLKPGGVKFKCSSCGATLTYRKKENKPVGETSSGPGTPTPPPSAAGPAISPPTAVPGREIPSVRESIRLPEETRPETFAPAPAEAPAQERDTEKEAAQIVRDSATPAKTGSRVSKNAVLAGAGAALIIMVLIAVFLFTSDSGKTGKPAPIEPSQPSASAPLQPPGLPAAPDSVQAPAPDSSGTAAPLSPPSTDVSSGMTDEKAIDMVKKSDALMKRTMVEAIVNKWAAENAAKYSIVGWQSKKMDEQNYLVSYTARDGDKTTGFYFNLDVQTGAVLDIARNKEFQAKYNIKYGN